MTNVKQTIFGNYLTIRSFYLISFVITFASFIFSAIFLTNDYIRLRADITYDLRVHNERIEQKLTDSFFYTKLIMRYVGRQVSNHSKPQDYNFVKKVLNGYRMPENGLMSWSILSWANKSHEIAVMRGTGILQKKKSLSHRDYIPRTIEFPESVQTGKPVLGIISGLYSIPIGYGVVDTHRKYIGAVISGIVIKNLKAQLERLIENPGISFAVIDVRYGVIAQSFDYKIPEVIVQKILKKFQNSNSEAIFYKNSYHQKLDRYPYIISTIYNKSAVNSNSRIRFSIYLMVMFLLLSFLSLIFYGFHKKITSPIIELTKFAEKIHRDEPHRKTPKFEMKEMKHLAQILHKIDRLISRDDRLKK